MGRRNRSKRIGRRRPFREQRPLILAICEGKTEKDYLEGVVRHQKNPRVRLKALGEQGAPRTVVEEAVIWERNYNRQASAQGDSNVSSIWCVFDRDQHETFDAALREAASQGFHAAVSVPCFELWLVLHHQDAPGAKTSRQMQNLLRQHVPSYGKRVEFKDYESGYAIAVRRAERLEARAVADGEPYRNPTTGVWRLTERIRDRATATET